MRDAENAQAKAKVFIFAEIVVMSFGKETEIEGRISIDTTVSFGNLSNKSETKLV